MWKVFSIVVWRPKNVLIYSPYFSVGHRKKKRNGKKEDKAHMKSEYKGGIGLFYFTFSKLSSSCYNYTYELLSEERRIFSYTKKRPFYLQVGMNIILIIFFFFLMVTM